MSPTLASFPSDPSASCRVSLQHTHSSITSHPQNPSPNPNPNFVPNPQPTIAMELQTDHSFRMKRPIMKGSVPAARWIKEWVPQGLVSGGKCSLLKWVTEGMLNSLREKCREPEKEEPESVPTTEILFLCSYEGCGKTFIDAGDLRKHAHFHGERQYACHFDGCGKKFLDSSKLKRHFLIHTGEKSFVCPHEGCGKAFSLDFNLKAHMRTHSLENYHVCHYEECGKRFTHEYKLNTHIKTHQEKNTMNTLKHQSPVERTPSFQKAPTAGVQGSGSIGRPYVCPYEGCDKDYIHEYKLKLHLKREHPGHNSEENGKHHVPCANHDMEENGDRAAFIRKDASGQNKRKKPTFVQEMPPLKVPNCKGLSFAPSNLSTLKKPWEIRDLYDEDSEETEDGESSENDDEETEDEE